MKPQLAQTSTSSGAPRQKLSGKKCRLRGTSGCGDLRMFVESHFGQRPVFFTRGSRLVAAALGMALVQRDALFVRSVAAAGLQAPVNMVIRVAVRDDRALAVLR